MKKVNNVNYLENIFKEINMHLSFTIASYTIPVGGDNTYLMRMNYEESTMTFHINRLANKKLNNDQNNSITVAFESQSQMRVNAQTIVKGVNGQKNWHRITGCIQEMDLFVNLATINNFPNPAKCVFHAQSSDPGEKGEWFALGPFLRNVAELPQITNLIESTRKFQTLEGTLSRLEYAFVDY